MRAWVLSSLLFLLAGCTAQTGTLDPDEDAPDLPLTASLPTFQTKIVTPTAAGTNPVEEAVAKVQGKDPEVAFTVPLGTGRLQLAVDFGDPADQGQPQGEASLTINAPSGAPAFRADGVTSWRKLITFIDGPAAGEYTFTATAQGNWEIGIVATFFPTDFTPGLVVNISKPEQTQVEHKFYPSKLTAQVGEPARVTLFDYDPHYGIRNNQHNWAVPELEIKTEGRTNWGRVYTVDFTPTKKGTFEFQCDYHEPMKGTLKVVAA